MATETVSMDKVIENFKNNDFVVGIRQSLKLVNIHPEKIKCVVLAKNTDKAIIDKVSSLTNSKKIKICYISDPIELARLANIDVPTSVVAILNK